MPKGPNGQKRPADVIGAANMVARIATGEITDTLVEPKGAAGGKARAERLAPKQRSEIASIAAKKRWQGKGGSKMSNQIDRAVSLLFPEGGRQALDIKFFNHATSTEESLAEQVISCMAAIDDPSLDIEDIDHA